MTDYLLLPGERYIEFPLWCLVRLFDETVKANLWGHCYNALWGIDNACL